MSRSPLFFTDLPDTGQQQIYKIGKSARDRQIESRWLKMQEMKHAAPLTEAEAFDGQITQPEADAGEKLLDAMDETADVETESDAADEWLFADAKDAVAFSADARDRLTEIVKNGTIKLQRGFMCFPENDPLIKNSKMVIPKDGFYDVAMHGTPTAVGFGMEETNMSPRLLANIIRHREDYHGENIRLLSCSTGYINGDDFCFAEELANALGVIVEAPDMPLYIYPNGTIKVGWLGEGKMIPYKPNGRGRIGARKEDKK